MKKIQSKNYIKADYQVRETQEYDEEYCQKVEEWAKRNHMETIFPRGTEYFDRIFYDFSEGKYWDIYKDMYLEPDELSAFGIGT